jgi:hypothetical protein
MNSTQSNGRGGGANVTATFLYQSRDGETLHKDKLAGGRDGYRWWRMDGGQRVYGLNGAQPRLYGEENIKPGITGGRVASAIGGPSSMAKSGPSPFNAQQDRRLETRRCAPKRDVAKAIVAHRHAGGPGDQHASAGILLLSGEPRVVAPAPVSGPVKLSSREGIRVQHAP